MKVSVKINDAEISLLKKSLRLNSELSQRISTAEFTIIGEEMWGLPIGYGTIDGYFIIDGVVVKPWAFPPFYIPVPGWPLQTEPSIAIGNFCAIGGHTLPYNFDECKIDRASVPMLNCAVANMIALGGNSTYLDHFFGGFIVSVEKFKVGIGNSRVLYKCQAQDYNILPSRRQVDKEYISKTEAEIINDLFGTYLPEIDTSTYVESSGITSTISWIRKSLTEALEELADIFGKEWYIDYDRRLHYFTSGANYAPFILSDWPFSSTVCGYKNIRHISDILNIANRVTIIGEANKDYPVEVAKYYSGVYTSYLSEVTDGDWVTHMPADGMLTTHFIYVGMAERFSAIKVQMGTNKNANVSVLSAEYSRGAGSWAALTITDGTDDAGKTLAKSGHISFDPPNDWEADTVDGTTNRYIRLKVSANLSAIVDIAELEATNFILTTRQDAASYAEYGQWFDGKVVDNSIKTVEWANARGDAELAQWAFEIVAGSLTCYQEGLVKGQQVKIINAFHKIDDYFLVRSVALSMIGPYQEQVEINYGDYKPNLTDALQKIKLLEQREQN